VVDSMPPNCPECGRPMTLRHRRSDGHPFYGCTGYPTCKGVVDANDAEGGQSPRYGDHIVLDSRPSELIPQTILAAPMLRDGITEFFQSCGAPSEFVYQCHDFEIERGLIRGVTQWRLDYPLFKQQELPQELSTILNVAESILLRGSLSFCSPNTEDALMQGLTTPTAIDDISRAMESIAINRSCLPMYDLFDSEEERIFWKLTSEWIESQNLRWQIIPQVHLSSLSNSIDVQSGQRCDFLFTDPLSESPPFIVEIDGKQHSGHAARDAQRDEALAQSGLDCYRIEASAVRDSNNGEISRFLHSLEGHSSKVNEESTIERVLRATKFIHQLQIALLRIITSGLFQNGEKAEVGVALPPILASTPNPLEVLKFAESDIQQLLERLSKLYGYEIETPQISLDLINDSSSDLKIIVCPSNQRESIAVKSPGASFILISDISFPSDISAPLSAAVPSVIQNPSRDEAVWFLNYLFRKPNFWDGQWEAVERSLMQKDSVVLLPTGGGKSIAFQLAAMLLPGRCVVIAPLIALINDQIDNLRRNGIDRCVGITSQISSYTEREARLNAFAEGHYLFCYVAPERFQISEFREALRALTVSVPINVVAIDEAHCVSEWGHDFRTSYLNIGRIAREYCESKGWVPPLIALTGTASKAVLKDTQRELGITDFDAIITPNSFDRPELRFHILRCRSEEKTSRVVGFIRSLPSLFGMPAGTFFQQMGGNSKCGIVFCPHVNGEYGISDVSNELKNGLPTGVGIYSGGPPRGVNNDEWDIRKNEAARAFKRNQSLMLVATKAFGMGIDKPNVRYTVHLGLPESIEAFYQEAGRAGRDGERAECLIILSDDLGSRSSDLLSPRISIGEVASQIESFGRNEADDITRNLWFHNQAFMGEAQDLEDVRTVMDDMGDISLRRTTTIVPHAKLGSNRNNARHRTEKAIHRLVVIGVVEDYTLNYSADEFSVAISGATKDQIGDSYATYAAAYQERLGQRARVDCQEIIQLEYSDFVANVAKMLIKFVYQHIELSRRSSLNEMLQAVSSTNDGEQLRSRILEFLQQSEYDSRLNEVISSQFGGLDRIGEIIVEIISPQDSAALRGGVARLLGSYPDNPGLLLLRCVSEVLSRDTDLDVAAQSLEAAMKFASTSYGISSEEIANALIDLVQVVARKPEATEKLVSVVMEWEGSDRNFLRDLTKILPSHLAVLPASRLLEILTTNSKNLRISTGATS